MNEFAGRLLKWYRKHGRHNLPWQVKPTPYRVWISEIMLQQTQVATVIPYYERFMAQYPDIATLAKTQQDDVLQIWAGLGYYARARNLHRTAKVICEDFAEKFPTDLETLVTLPGIGRSTAAAILSLSMNQPHAILDGNVKRVLTRFYGVTEWPGKKSVENRLWDIAEMLTPQKNTADYNQAIMDLGAMICTRTSPKCAECPQQLNCVACQENTQSEIPAKKPRKSLPVKQAIFALVENSRGEILLEKGPPTGIWGGLWSFPECPAGTDLPEWLSINYGYEVTSARAVQGMRHTFSHFHLDIIPVKTRYKRMSNAIMEAPELRWIKPEEGVKLGTAAPVKKLIKNVYLKQELMYDPHG